MVAQCAEPLIILRSPTTTFLEINVLIQQLQYYSKNTSFLISSISWFDQRELQYHVVKMSYLSNQFVGTIATSSTPSPSDPNFRPNLITIPDQRADVLNKPYYSIHRKLFSMPTIQLCEQLFANSELGSDPPRGPLPASAVLINAIVCTLNCISEHISWPVANLLSLLYLFHFYLFSIK